MKSGPFAFFSPCQTRGAAVVSVVTLLLLVAPAFGGRYELAKSWYTGVHSDRSSVNQSDLPLCQAYEKNLNSYPNEQPLSCDRPINPEFKDFGKPDWKPLDAMKYIDLIRQMDKVLFYRFRPESFDEAQWLESTRKQIARGLLRLSIAQLDVGAVSAPNYGVNDQPDGIPDHVLRYERGQPCNPATPRDSNFLSIDYFVVNDDMTKVKEFRARGRNVFLYKGKAYFDSFSIAYMQDPDLGDPSRSAHLLPRKRFEIFVQEPYGGTAVTICRFRSVN